MWQPCRAGMGKLDVVADLALEADVGDEAEIGFRIEARHVARIGVAVGIAVGDIEQQDEIVAIGDARSLSGLLRGRAVLRGFEEFVALVVVAEAEQGLILGRQGVGKGSAAGSIAPMISPISFSRLTFRPGDCLPILLR